jgi:hypothetical protein
VVSFCKKQLPDFTSRNYCVGQQNCKSAIFPARASTLDTKYPAFDVDPQSSRVVGEAFNGNPEPDACADRRTRCGKNECSPITGIAAAAFVLLAGSILVFPPKYDRRLQGIANRRSCQFVPIGQVPPINVY